MLQQEIRKFLMTQAIQQTGTVSFPLLFECFPLVLPLVVCVPLCLEPVTHLGRWR